MKPREIIYLVLLVVLTGAGVFGLSKLKAWYVGSQQNEQAQRTLKATSDIIGDGVAADEYRSARDTGVAAAGQGFRDRYQEDVRNDKATADRADRVVPQRVRDNFRARRLERERLGCVGSQCRTRAADDDAAER